MTSTIVAISDIPVNKRFVIYGESTEGSLYFADAIDGATLKSIPRSVDNPTITEDCTIELWTHPFEQEKYHEFLTLHAHITCGKDVRIGAENGWTKHRITI